MMIIVRKSLKLLLEKEKIFSKVVSLQIVNITGKHFVLTLLQTTNFRFFQTERICRRQFQF